MNKELLMKAGIDYENGVQRFMGRAHLYDKVLRKFPKDGTIERIRTDYRENNMANLLSDAHEFKGMCGNLAMARLHEAADMLVLLLRDGTFSGAQLAAAYELLEREYCVAKDAILAAMEDSNEA